MNLLRIARAIHAGKPSIADADFRFDLKDVVARKALRVSQLEKENGDLRALVCRLRRFIHNEAAIAIADTDEFEAIDREIAAMGIRVDLGKETE